MHSRARSPLTQGGGEKDKESPDSNPLRLLVRSLTHLPAHLRPKTISPSQKYSKCSYLIYDGIFISLNEICTLPYVFHHVISYIYI